jgi:hypothetical protein
MTLVLNSLISTRPAFFVHFNTLILRRSHKHFSFRNCSVGNAFLAAARDMLGGLPGAIFMFRAVSDSQGSGAVLPVILTNRECGVGQSPGFVDRQLTPRFDWTATERITIAARLVSRTTLAWRTMTDHLLSLSLRKTANSSQGSE